jgi:hypothetical protein
MQFRRCGRGLGVLAHLPLHLSLQAPRYFDASLPVAAAHFL